MGWRKSGCAGDAHYSKEKFRLKEACGGLRQAQARGNPSEKKTSVSRDPLRPGEHASSQSCDTTSPFTPHVFCERHSAPQNIAGLQARGASRRGARGHSGPPGSHHAGRGNTADDAVRNTDQDAAGSRVSCVELGYLHDPYAKLFASEPATRRLPLLNRGMSPV